jgi:hypothetical protein
MQSDQGACFDNLLQAYTSDQQFRIAIHETTIACQHHLPPSLPPPPPIYAPYPLDLRYIVSPAPRSTASSSADASVAAQGAETDVAETDVVMATAVKVTFAAIAAMAAIDPLAMGQVGERRPSCPRRRQSRWVVSKCCSVLAQIRAPTYFYLYVYCRFLLLGTPPGHVASFCAWTYPTPNATTRRVSGCWTGQRRGWATESNMSSTGLRRPGHTALRSGGGRFLLRAGRRNKQAHAGERQLRREGEGGRKRARGSGRHCAAGSGSGCLLRS